MGQGAARPHRGHCPTPKCLWELPGPSCPNAMENPLEPLVIVRETKPLQSLPKEGLVSFIPSSGSGLDQQLPLEPWMAGPGPRMGPGVSPTPCPWFWGHSVTSVGLRNDSYPHLPVSLEWGYWPSWWDSAGAWNVVNAAL